MTKGKDTAEPPKDARKHLWKALYSTKNLWVIAPNTPPLKRGNSVRYTHSCTALRSLARRLDGLRKWGEKWAWGKPLW